jgi:hypothetical protein
MPNRPSQPPVDRRNAVASSSRPSGNDDLHSMDFDERLEQSEIDKIARAQIELLRTLAKIAVEKLHGTSVRELQDLGDQIPTGQ